MVVLGSMGSMFGSVTAQSDRTPKRLYVPLLTTTYEVAYAIVLILVKSLDQRVCLARMTSRCPRIIERIMNKDFPWNKDDSDEQAGVYN